MQGTILKWSTCKSQSWRIWPMSISLSGFILLTHENWAKPSVWPVFSYMTDGVLATNRRGRIIMVNEMAAKQLNVNPDEVLNTSILDLLSLGDDYDLRSLITKYQSWLLIPRMKMGNAKSFVCALPWFVASQVYLWSGSCLCTMRQSRTKEGRSMLLSPMWVMNYGHPLTSVKSYPTLDDGALSEPVAPNFVKGFLNETSHALHMVTDLLSLSRIDN